MLSSSALFSTRVTIAQNRTWAVAGASAGLLWLAAIFVFGTWVPAG
jgi:hypothetical protein